MKFKILAMTLTLLLASGCASKQYQLGSDTQVASACGQSATVAIEGGENVAATDEECREMANSAKAGNGGGDLVLKVLAYTAGFALGSALF